MLLLGLDSVVGLLGWSQFIPVLLPELLSLFILIWRLLILVLVVGYYLQLFLVPKQKYIRQPSSSGLLRNDLLGFYLPSCIILLRMQWWLPIYYDKSCAVRLMILVLFILCPTHTYYRSLAWLVLLSMYFPRLNMETADFWLPPKFPILLHPYTLILKNGVSLMDIYLFLQWFSAKNSVVVKVWNSQRHCYIKRSVPQ